MAVDILNKDKEEQAGTGTAGAAPPPGAGQAPSQPSSVTAPTGAGSPAMGKSQTGSGFVNLQKVIGANQNNKLGSTVAGGITGAAQKTNQGLANAKQDFQQKTQANQVGGAESVAARDNTINKIVNFPVNTTGQGPNAQATTTPVQSPITDADADQFVKFQSGTYEGPTGLANFEDLAQQALRTQQLGDATRSGGGIQNLLRQYVGKGAYTQGQQGLDRLILGQTGGKDLAQARRTTVGATSALQNAEQGAANTAEAQKALAQQFALDTKKKLADTRTGLESGIDKQYTDADAAEKARLSDFDAIRSDLTKEYNNAEIPQITNPAYLNWASRKAAAGVSGMPFNEPMPPQMINDPNYQGSGQIDTPQTRAQGALQTLLNKGYLNQDTYNQLNSQMENAVKYGLDPTELINQNLSSINAQNLAKSGFVNDASRAQLGALNRLSGRTNAEDTYLNGSGAYQKGNIALDSGTINSTIDDYKKLMDDEIAYRQLSAEEQQRQGAAAQARMDQLRAQQSRWATQGAGGIAWDASNAAREGLLGSNVNDMLNRTIDNLSPTGLVSGAKNTVDSIGSAVGNIFSGWSDKNLKTDIKDGNKSVESFLDSIKPYDYKYTSEKFGKGPQTSVMAQDLEKTAEGKASIEEHPEGKKVNYAKLAGMMLASQANLNARLKKLEGKK